MRTKRKRRPKHHHRKPHYVKQWRAETPRWSGKLYMQAFNAIGRGKEVV